MNKNIQQLYHIYNLYCDENICDMSYEQLFHYITNLLHVDIDFNKLFVKSFGDINNDKLKVFVDFCYEIDLYCYHFIINIPVESKRNNMSFQEYIYTHIDTDFKFIDIDKFQYYDVWHYAINNIPEIELLYSHLEKLINDNISSQLSKSFNVMNLLKKI